MRRQVGSGHRPRWPDNASCVVAITLDWDGTSVELDDRLIPLGAHSHGRYTAKCGVPRYLEIFRRHQVAATVFVPGYDAECNPDLVHQVALAGHEIGAHGYQHEARDLGEQEPGLLRKTHDVLTAITGRQPRGWRAPSGRKSALTIQTLRSLGYRYDSSDKDHDLPYLARLEGVVLDDYMFLPNNTSSLDDYPLFDISFTPASEVLTHWKQEFDAIYGENGYFNLTIHPRNGYGSGSPARARIVDHLITYMKQFEGVRFVKLIDLAEWCLSDASRWRLERESGLVDVSR